MFNRENNKISHSIWDSIITSVPNIKLDKNDQPIIINLVLFNAFSYLLFFLKLNWITILLIWPIKLMEYNISQYYNPFQNILQLKPIHNSLFTLKATFNNFSMKYMIASLLEIFLFNIKLMNPTKSNIQAQMIMYFIS